MIFGVIRTIVEGATVSVSNPSPASSRVLTRPRATWAGAGERNSCTTLGLAEKMRVCPNLLPPRHAIKEFISAM